MCLNEELSYSIKVKSRNCELFILKKNDFLKVSVNFKEIIEKFLKKSLMVYLSYNDQIKKILKEQELKHKEVQNKTEIIDESFFNKSKLKNSFFDAKRTSHRDTNNQNNNDERNLEKISEKSREEKVGSSEEYNIYYHNESSDDSVHINNIGKNDRMNTNSIIDYNNVLRKTHKIRVDTNPFTSENDVGNFMMKNKDSDEILFFNSEKNMNYFNTNQNEKEIFDLKIDSKNSIIMNNFNDTEKVPCITLNVCKTESDEKALINENNENTISYRYNKEHEEIDNLFSINRRKKINDSNKILINVKKNFTGCVLDNQSKQSGNLKDNNHLKINENFKKSKSDNNFIIKEDLENSLNFMNDDIYMKENKKNKKCFKYYPLTTVIPERKLSKRYKGFTIIKGKSYEAFIRKIKTKSSNSILKLKNESVKKLHSSDGQKEIIKQIKSLSKNKTKKKTKPEEKNLENFVNVHRDKFNNVLNNKMEQIIKFFDSLNINFDDLPQDENPIKLFMKLTEIQNCYERNEIIDKIDIVVNNL